jgi:hypothetical protein
MRFFTATKALVRSLFPSTSVFPDAIPFDNEAESVGDLEVKLFLVATVCSETNQ